jgi:hypothetical protein
MEERLDGKCGEGKMRQGNKREKILRDEKCV